MAVTAIVLFTFAAWAVLGYEASVPRFFMDELAYMKAGVSIAQGHGLQFEGRSWGYGPFFPFLVACFVKVTAGQEQAYELVKAANAAFFALASVPIYLMSRRLLPPWPSVGVVALSALVPSSMYVSVSMTESVGYLIACWSMYLTFRVLEQPSVRWQLLALGVVVLAIAARPQFAALYGAYLVGLGLLIVGSPRCRPRARSLWPTALAIVGGLAWLAWPLVQGHGVGRSLGAYSPLAQSYDPLQVARWFVYEVGDLALYFGVAPLVVAPIVIVLWWRRARGGSAPDAAFLALFVAQNLVGIGLVAAFASSTYGLGVRYDRYVFYLIPLWLLALVTWIHERMPRPGRALAAGIVATAVVAVTVPFAVAGRQSWSERFEAVAFAAWGKIVLLAARAPLVSVRIAGVFLIAAIVIAVAVVPRRYVGVYSTIVALVLAANLSLAWRSAFVDPATYGLSNPGLRGFVDARVGDVADVTVLVVRAECARAEPQQLAMLETDFFNRSVRRTISVNEGRDVSLTVRADGTLSTRSGNAVAARYLVTPHGVAVHGRRLGTGMAANLVLWDVGGPVRLENVHSDRQLFAIACTT